MMSPIQTAIEKISESLQRATEPSQIALLTEKLIEAIKKAEESDERLMTLEEGAHYLGLKPATLRKFCSAQKVPHVKVGSLTRFSRESLVKWALSQEKKQHPVYRR